MHKDKMLKAWIGGLCLLVILYFGSTIFVPFFFALLLSFILFPFCRWLERKGFNRIIAIALSLLVLTIPIAAIVLLLIGQISEITHQWIFIREKLFSTLSGLNLPFGIELDAEGEWFRDLMAGNASRIYSGFINSAGTLVQVIIIPIYVALLLYHRKRLLLFIVQLIPDMHPVKIRQILEDTVVTYHNFIKGMLVVYLAVGILNSIGLLLLGIPNAVVFGFTASVLTFIPYVGIILGAVIPMIVAWSIHDSLYFPLGVVAVFTIVQALEAYLIFPMAVSYRIRVNTLVTLLAIFSGAIIWGAAGMILFIPFLAIVKLISERVEGLKALDTLLGAEGHGARIKKTDKTTTV